MSVRAAVSVVPLTRPLAILGGGGHARVVLDALRAAGLPVMGIIDPRPSVLAPWLGVGLSALHPGECDVVIGVGSIAPDSERRIRLYQEAVDAGFSVRGFRHPSAIVSPGITEGPGCQIMAGAIIQAGVRLGCNVIVNTGAQIDHDTQVGDHVHVAPGAVLCGSVVVGARSHIGANATVIQGVKIGEAKLVRAGSLARHDV